MFKEDSLSLEERMMLAQKGDNKAYTSLLEESAKIIRSYLYKRVSDQGQIEDIVQEILISLHNAKHTYDSSRKFTPWLFSIAKFRLMDYFRATYRKQAKEEALYQEATLFIEENVTEQAFAYEELYKELDKLPKKQRYIIELMKLKGFTAKEVAKKMNMSESAVKVAAHRIYKV